MKLSKIKGPVKLLGVNKISQTAIEYRITVETIPLSNIEVENEIKLAAKNFRKNKIEIIY